MPYRYNKNTNEHGPLSVLGEQTKSTQPQYPNQTNKYLSVIGNPEDKNTSPRFPNNTNKPLSVMRNDTHSETGTVSNNTNTDQLIIPSDEKRTTVIDNSNNEKELLLIGEGIERSQPANINQVNRKQLLFRSNKKTGVIENTDNINRDQLLINETDTSITYKNQVNKDQLLFDSNKRTNNTNNNLKNNKGQLLFDSDKRTSPTNDVLPMNNNQLLMGSSQRTNSTETDQPDRKQLLFKSNKRTNKAKDYKTQINKPLLVQNSSESNINSFHSAMKSNLIYTRDDIKWVSKFNRFNGWGLDPFNRLNGSKEYLFFTRPDLNIYKSGKIGELQNIFKNDPFWEEMNARYPYILQTLQRSCISDNDDLNKTPFMNILTNAVSNTMDAQGLLANEMDTPTNIHGTTMTYRKDAWTGDENQEFSLEFNDTKYLEIYNLVRAYEEYERHVTMGDIYPPGGSDEDDGNHYSAYIQKKELHDTFGVFRIIVDEDFETIIYASYYCGCYFKNVPRDALNDVSQNGIKLNLDFKAFCMVEMPDPTILSFFNSLVTEKRFGGNPENIPNTANSIPIYNMGKGRINGDEVTYPYIIRVPATNGRDSNQGKQWYFNEGMKYAYKLKWF